MKRLLTFVSLITLMTSIVPAHGATELTLNQVMKAGTVGYYDHHQGLILAEGFWAQAGSDLTATINQTPGYYIDKSPLDSQDKQYTSTDSRTYVVAGCVPKNLPIRGPVGSIWVACNDLDYVKDKVVESAFISCLSLFKNGVAAGASIKEINNKTWESFRFSCRDLGADGRLAPTFQKTDFLFDFAREGTLHEAKGSEIEIFYGIKEYWNSPPSKEALASFAFMHAPAASLREGKRSDPPNTSLNYFRQTDVIPGYPPQIPLIKTSTTEWMCPPTMVLTGMAIGHNPDKKGNDTRPIYILAECRTLLHNP